MTLRFFGRLRDSVGVSHMMLAVPPHIADSDALRRWIGEEYPALLDPSVRIAIDDVLAIGAIPLSGASEAAFLPPVSGG